MKIMVLASPKDRWRRESQPTELAHWKTAYERGDPMTGQTQLQDSRQVMELLGVAEDEFAGAVILDVGPGPTGRICSLQRRKLVAIEPLADQYDHLDAELLVDYDEVYCLPVEQPIPKLIDTIDVAISLNALDHCYDPEQALTNIYRYLRPRGRLLLSFDVDVPHARNAHHPLHATHEEARAMIERVGFIVGREWSGRCYPGRDNWGAGTAYHWWCHKPSGEKTFCIPNEKAGYCYLNIAKTACSSIKVAIAQHMGVTAADLVSPRRSVALALWRPDLYRFSFVRNPFDKLVSAWADMTPDRTLELNPDFAAAKLDRHGKRVSFPRFVRNVESMPASFADWHLSPQIDQLRFGGRWAVDEVCRFERLHEDWRKLQDRFGLPDLPHERKSTRKPYREYYTPDLRRIAEKLYAEDLGAFDYSF